MTTTRLEADPAAAVAPKPVGARGGLRRIRRSRAAAVGLGILVAYVLVSLFAPAIAPHNPATQYAGMNMHGPTLRFLAGTDEFGRDIFSRVLYAGRDSLYVGVVGVVIGGAIGAVLGVVGGYLGGVLDVVLMRIVDLGLGFPAVIIGVVVVAIRGPGATNLAIAIALFNVPIFIRIMRSITLQVKARPFVEVATAMGIRDREILRHHILPNVLPSLLIQAGIAMPAAILIEAGLAFLGLGARPPAPTLGGMLSEARAYLGVSPWYAIAPGISLSVLVIALNLLVDGLRDVLDPRRAAAMRRADES